MTKPRFIPPDEIEKTTLAVLSEHHAGGSYPIPIEEIVELRLNLEIVPVKNLMQNHSIDGFLSSDNMQMYIDEHQYMNNQSRARFTMAHETGHYVLHKKIIAKHRISSIAQWKTIVLGDQTGRSPLETQANIFAGYLLMPTQFLREEFDRLKKDFLRRFEENGGGARVPNDSALKEYIAKPIAKLFNVSEQAASIRLGYLS